jgi:hypothetical protein
MMHWPKQVGLLCSVASLWACASTSRRFPLHEPLWQDSDLRSVTVGCRSVPSKKDPGHVSCAPEPYQSPIIWDGVDNLFFRPLSELLALPAPSEAVNVNSLDEVPDSSWFTNRIGRRPMSIDELQLGACDRSLLLDPESAADGTWVIDKGKMGGSTPGFRVSIAGKKYLFKADDADQPERASAAATIGLGVYHAAGYNTSCEQVVYFKPSLLKLSPGLRYKRNFGDEKEFDRAALEAVLAPCAKRDGRVRMQASAWIRGYTIGSFRYEGTRSDDPNDVVPHEDRRELRGARLLAAWLDRVDAREGNTLDSWFADGKDPEASPGRVVHYMIDTSEVLGPAWDWEQITRRMGYSYVFDWGDFATDFVTLGIPIRTWDVTRTTPGHEMFSYFNVKDFAPDHWKMEYPNAAFSRMTERDGAWMARILAHFTPDKVRALAETGRFTDPDNTAYVASVLEGRLERILDRYLTRLSSIADVRVEGQSALCGVDLAEWRGVREPGLFRYSASSSVPGVPLSIERRGNGGVCATLSHVAPDGGPAADSPDRYVVVTLRDGVAQGPLVVHLYDLGPARGYRLVGLERPER